MISPAALTRFIRAPYFAQKLHHFRLSVWHREQVQIGLDALPVIIEG